MEELQDTICLQDISTPCLRIYNCILFRTGCIVLAPLTL